MLSLQVRITPEGKTCEQLFKFILIIGKITTLGTQTQSVMKLKITQTQYVIHIDAIKKPQCQNIFTNKR